MSMKKNFETMMLLSQNENPLGPSPSALRIIRKASKDINRYPEPHSGTLTDALAAHLGLNPENLFVCAGSTEALDIIIRNLVGKGENMITASVTFAAYKLIAEVYGVDVRFSEMKDHRYDVKDILRIYNPDTRVITIANPNNPTGTIITHREVVGLLKAIDPATYLVIDEAYMEYVNDTSYPRTMELRLEYPNLILLRTFSKIYGLAGLRVGYAIISPEVNRKLGRFQAPFTVNKLASIGALAALNDQDFVEMSKQQNRKGRDYLTGNLRKLGIAVPDSQSNFVYLPFENREQRDAVAETLKDNHIIARNTDLFGDPCGIRLTVGSAVQNKSIISCLSTTH